MPWLPSYQQGLAGWGSPPDLRAAPIEGLVRSIWAMREKQRENVQNSLSDAIQQYHKDKVANALTGAYAEEGLIPQELTGQGTMGLGASTDYIKAQQYRTEPTDLGGGYNLPLTREQQLKVIMEKAHLARVQAALGGRGGGQYGDHETYTDDEGRLWVQGVRGGWHLAPVGMQPSVQQQKGQAATLRSIPNIQTFLGTTADPTTGKPVKRSMSDFDFESAWDSPTQGFKEVPVLNPAYDRTKPPGEQDQQPYRQINNPAYDNTKPPSAENPPTITHTVRIPKAAYNKAFGITGQDEAAAASTAPPTTGLGGLNDQDQKALAWADANPDDPRAAEIRKRLGVE